MKHSGMGSDLGIPRSHFSFLRSATQHQRRVPRPSICSDSSSPYLLLSSLAALSSFILLPRCPSFIRAVSLSCVHRISQPTRYS